MKDNIQLFFTSLVYAVIGASNNRKKYGNKVLRCYLQHKMPVIPVNPHEINIEGINVCQQIAELPSSVKSISVITPPEITENIVDQAIAKDIKNIWIQPGAESELAIKKCKENGLNVIAYGPCILVELGFTEDK